MNHLRFFQLTSYLISQDISESHNLFKGQPMPLSHSYLNRNYFSQFITEVSAHGYAHEDSILNTNAM